MTLRVALAWGGGLSGGHENGQIGDLYFEGRADWIYLMGCKIRELSRIAFIPFFFLSFEKLGHYYTT